MSCRKQCIGRIAALLVIAVLVESAAVPDARAQTALERLEQQIRKQLQQEQGQPPAKPPAAKPRREPGYLGMVADDKNDRGRGVRILEVRPGGPADKAGLKPGDLITGLAGMRLRQMSDMAVILQQVPPRGSVMFEVLRDGQKRQIEVVAAERPPVGQAPAGQAPPARPPEAAVKPAPAPAPAPAPKAYLPGPVAPRPGPPPTPDDRVRIEQLQRRVEALERRVAELEAQLRDAIGRNRGARE